MIVLAAARLRAITDDEVWELAGAREAVVAFAEGELRGPAAAAILFSDYCIMTESTTIALDSAMAWGAVAWRIGDEARALLLSGRWSARARTGSEPDHESTAGSRVLSSRRAKDYGLCEDVVAILPDVSQWAGNRSTSAIDSGAVLLSRRGGDTLERAEFARLFASGQPQEGLRAFLEKRQPCWSQE